MEGKLVARQAGAPLIKFLGRHSDPTWCRVVMRIRSGLMTADSEGYSDIFDKGLGQAISSIASGSGTGHGAGALLTTGGKLGVRLLSLDPQRAHPRGERARVDAQELCGTSRSRHLVV